MNIPRIAIKRIRTLKPLCATFSYLLKFSTITDLAHLTDCFEVWTRSELPFLLHDICFYIFCGFPIVFSAWFTCLVGIEVKPYEIDPIVKNSFFCCWIYLEVWYLQVMVFLREFSLQDVIQKNCWETMNSKVWLNCLVQNMCFHDII